MLQDLGTLDFGKGMAARFNVALCRERGMERPLHEKALDRAKRFFVAAWCSADQAHAVRPACCRSI